jgi:hypothetical protein
LLLISLLNTLTLPHSGSLSQLRLSNDDLRMMMEETSGAADGTLDMKAFLDIMECSQWY